MSLHDIMPFRDKNSERYTYSKRVTKYIRVLQEDYLETFSQETGNFLLRDGQHTIDQINEGKWSSYNPDEQVWGYRECYCWFKQTVIIPEDAAGLKLRYHIMPEQDRFQFQAILYVNGKMVQGIDRFHQFAILTENAVPGEKFEIYINAYEDDFAYAGPLRMRARLYSIDEEVEGLMYDLQTCLDVANLCGVDDSARINNLKYLTEACDIVRTELPYGEEFLESVKVARNIIATGAFGKSERPLVSVIGHTHIDVAWLWRLRQTRDKAGRTFASMLYFMDHYPDFKFMSSQAQLYKYVKEDYPEIYERIKQAVKDGKWEVEGGMWVEADTNVSSGESLVRQLLLGKRFFKKEFDVDCEILWLPDVFGYSAALPQILKKSGIKYFMTTKESWNEYTKIPYDTFKWKGIDGSEILSHFICAQRSDREEMGEFNTTYNGYLAPDQVIGGWKRYQQKDLNDNILFSAGHGDGGGGTDRDMIEFGARMSKGIEGCPKVKWEFAGDFFKNLEKDIAGKNVPKWRGELYLEFHRATYTSQAANKRYNRKSELLYHDVETLGTLNGILNKNFAKYDSTTINNAWEIICLNQFHDIIPGSSIRPVYEDSKIQYEEIIKDGNALADTYCKNIADNVNKGTKSAVVFNTTGFNRNDIAFVEGEYSGFSDGDISLPTQKTYNGKTVFLARNVPAKGYKSFSVSNHTEFDNTAKINGNTYETKFFIIEFNENMEISKLIHKETGREVSPNEITGKLIAYEDRPYEYDAWNTQVYYKNKAWPVEDLTSCEVVENGAVRCVIKLVRKFRKSTITQYISLYNDIDRIDVYNEIDWHELAILLRADFPVDVNTTRATFDIQFGNIERNTHNNLISDFAQFEVSAHKWADMSDNSFGLSVLNDCKYGHSAKEGHLGISLLRAQNSPCKMQDIGKHILTYSIYPHAGSFAQSKVVKHGYSLNIPLHAVISEGNGTLIPEYSLISVTQDNIIIETVKKAEDSDDIIVRCYETLNKKTKADFTFGSNFAKVKECDLMENVEAEIANNTNHFISEFNPFEIKTFKISLK